jgi:hypothetical protein
MTDLVNFIQFSNDKLTGNIATLSFDIDLTGEAFKRESKGTGLPPLRQDTAQSLDRGRCDLEEAESSRRGLLHAHLQHRPRQDQRQSWSLPRPGR